jgi:uncharacterized integral membrane protein
MLTLLVTVVLGILFAIFATQNTGFVTLNFGNYVIQGIPVYLAILAPLLVGILLSFFLHLAKDLSQGMTISEERNRIANLKKQLAEVTKAVHKLEIENSKLKEKTGKVKDENSI